MIRGVTAAVCLVVTLLVTLHGTPRQQEQAAPPTFTLDAIFDGAATGDTASRPVWSPDGTQLAYVWEEGESSAIWVLDVESGKARSVFGLGDFSWAERDADPTQISGAGYQWAPHGEALVAQLETDLYLIDVAAGTARRLTETPQRESDPRFSPDGAQVAFVRDFDLVLLDLESGAERVLTDDGDGDRIRNGIPDWVYWEELWGREGRGYWWSPEGGSIAYYRFDDSAVGRYPLANQMAPYPDVTGQRYPTAGTDNPTVQVGVLRLAGGATTWLQTGSGSDVYLARVDWAEDASAIYVQRLNRDQTRLELLQCDPEDGRCKTLITEEQPTWVNLSDDYEILNDGRIVWPSERSGWKQLYLYSPNGALVRQITQVPGAVASLESVDEKSGEIIFTAFGPPPLGAARREVYRASLEGGKAEPLSTTPGWNTADVAPGGSGSWIHGWSDANRPGESIIRTASGKVVAKLPSKAAKIDPQDLPAWELLTIPGPDGSKLPARMMRPPDRNANERYPVIMYHYGGPGSQVVTDRWDDAPRSLWLKLMAQRGYVVFSVDNLASAFFGKRGEDRLHRRFGEVELAAQRAGVDYLSSLPFVDPKRIGIWGWSGGGFNTLYSLTHAPGVWRAGVAGAPVADLTFYDTIWMERYMDHPADNAEGYRDSSPLTAADKLRDRLLIVHGLADDNVHPNNSVAFVAKMTDLG
ncbi:MAG: DPP IV N-terminal domain-containing protein, partial [Vicinamibacteraceae bacterium]